MNCWTELHFLTSECSEILKFIRCKDPRPWAKIEKNSKLYFTHFSLLHSWLIFIHKHWFSSRLGKVNGVIKFNEKINFTPQCAPTKNNLLIYNFFHSFLSFLSFFWCFSTFCLYFTFTFYYFSSFFLFNQEEETWNSYILMIIFSASVCYTFQIDLCVYVLQNRRIFPFQQKILEKSFLFQNKYSVLEPFLLQSFTFCRLFFCWAPTKIYMKKHFQTLLFQILYSGVMNKYLKGKRNI